MSEKTNGTGAVVAKHPATENGKKGFPLTKIVCVLLIVCAAFLLVVGIVNAVIDSFTSKMNGPAINDAEKKVDSIKDMGMYDLDYLNTKAVYIEACDKVLANVADASTSIIDDANVLNIVIAGIGKFDGEETGEADIIVLASINKSTKAVKYIFMEKLLLAYIPTVGIGHLNDAYEWGGAPLLAKTVMHNLGVKVDGYVEMDIQACLKMVDSVGGISIDGTDAKVTELNASIKAYNDRMGLTGDNAVKDVALADGKIALNGQQTIAYVRGADDNRFEQIKTVFSKISAKLAGAGLGGAMDCLGIATESMVVYLEEGDFSDMIKIGLGMFDGANVVDGIGATEKYCLPSDFRPIVTWDYEAERALIANAIYGE
ncbi:MAG: LCP family protein [Clostridia bacterium]|nr:LCP family protein [Clostridia bacterium]